MIKKPKSPFLAVDGVILEKDKVLLVKRNHFPFVGWWTLPGGHVKYGETVEKAIKREIKEELGVEVKIEKLLGVYSALKRDPRYHTVSVIYLLKKIKGEIHLNREASEFRFFSLKNLPVKIGFDHKKVLYNLRKNIIK